MEYSGDHNDDGDDSSYINNDDNDDNDDENFSHSIVGDDDEDNDNNIGTGSDEYAIDTSRSKKRSSKRSRNNVENGSDEDKRKDRRNRNINERIIPLKPDELYVDWGNLIDTATTSSSSNSRWIQQPFINHNLPLIEIDKLVGYTTHITTYHHPCTNTTSSNGGGGTTTLPTASTVTAMGDIGRRLFFNPLLGLPNVPLRPTLLKHLILDPATKLTSTYIHRQQQQQSIYDNNNADSDNDDDDDSMDDDNDKRVHRRPKKRKRKTKNQQYQYLYERFHHSASIAIGMIVEEMVTASFLPLAQQYVQYCRQLQSKSSTAAYDNTDGKIWTIPPEEAILKLYQNQHDSSSSPVTESISSLTSLLSSRTPTRTIVSGAIGTSILNQPTTEDHQRITYDNWWCSGRNRRGTKVQQQLIENDANFFQLLIRHTPSLQEPVVVAVAAQSPKQSTTIDAILPPSAPAPTTTIDQVAFEI